MTDTLITDAQKISDYYDYLFSNLEGKAVVACLWGWFYRSKTTDAISGKKGYFLPPSIQFASSKIQLYLAPGEVFDISLSFDVNGPKTIEVKDLKNKEDGSLFTIEDIFEIAIHQAGGEITTESAIIGYVKKKFAKQKHFKTYKVTLQKSGLYIVEVLAEKGKKEYWEPQSNKSPRTKSVINQFKKELDNDTLQTEFVK